MSTDHLMRSYTSPFPDNATGPTSSPVTEPGPLFRAVLWNMHLYVTPAIIIVGLIGNVCSFVIFVFTHLRELSTSVYLASLAVADTGFLLQLFAMWLGYVRVFVFHMNGWCQTFVYVSYVTSFLSVWLVVGFTVERYVAVCHPLKRHDMCTLNRAKIVVAALTAFSLLFYSFSVWTSGLVRVGGRKACMCLPRYIKFVTIMNNFDTVVTLVIPMLTIVALNTRIVCATTRLQRPTAPPKPHRQLSCSSAASAVAAAISPTRLLLSDTPTEKRVWGSVHGRSQAKITKMLLAVSTTFVLLNLPSHAIRVYFFIVGIVDANYRPSRELLVVQEVSVLVYYFNFAVNFFLYSLCGDNFRKALWNLATKCRFRADHHRRATSSQRYKMAATSTFVSKGQETL